MATYAAAAALRTELGVNASTLPDADANRLIETAEDLIDGELAQPLDDNGDPYPIDTTTGRRITEADVDAWRWAKLGRATVLVAAELYVSPGLAKGRQWHAESGPDFSFTGPLGSDLGRQVASLLAATGWYSGRTGSARVGSLADESTVIRRDLSLPI